MTLAARIRRRFRRAPVLVVDQCSGRFDVTPDELAEALDRSAGTGADVQVWTEVNRPGLRRTLEAWCAVSGWQLVHPDDEPGQAECAIVARRGLEVRHPHARLLTRLRLRYGRTTPQNAVVCTIRHPAGGCRVRVAGAHTPAHVEAGGPRVFRAEWPAKVYRAVARGFSRIGANASPWRVGRLLAADWNLSHRNDEVLDYLEREYVGLRSGWDLDDLPAQGTHGRRIIDGVWTDLELVEPTRVLPRRPGFDHRHTRTVVRLRLAAWWRRGMRARARRG